MYQLISDFQHAEQAWTATLVSTGRCLSVGIATCRLLNVQVNDAKVTSIRACGHRFRSYSCSTSSDVVFGTSLLHRERRSGFKEPNIRCDLPKKSKMCCILDGAIARLYASANLVASKLQRRWQGTPSFSLSSAAFLSPSTVLVLVKLNAHGWARGFGLWARY